MFVPTPLTDHDGTHEIPWTMLGWDLRILGSENSHLVLGDYLDQVVLDARNSGCDSAVFSSEDFSLLNSDQWAILLSEIYSRAKLTGSVQFHFVAVRREIAESVSSHYKTLVLAGLSRKFDDVQADLEYHFANLHKSLGQIPGQFDVISQVTEISYTSNGMVSVFMKHVFPFVGIPEGGFEENHLNRSYPEDMIEMMRAGNIGTGVEFRNQTLMYWPSFHTLASVTHLLARRHQIFGAYDAAESERDELATERDALASGTSWNIPGALRALGRFLRRE